MYEQLFSLSGRVVIITGGAGHLGRELTKALASFGAHVVAVGRSEGRFPEPMALNAPTLSGSVDCIACDVTDAERFTAVVDGVWRKHGRIDGLINNAASGRREKWEQLDKKGWLDGFEGLLNHYFTSTKAVSRYMLEARSGTVINTASIWGFVAPIQKMYLDLNNNPPAYVSAAKGAILQLTRHLASEWAGRGIRVNAISPGWFPQKRSPERLDYMQEITSRIPMGRIGVPADIVGAVIFLASDASAYVTGQNLIVDGGYSIW